ncbi:glycoside hydrolase [bacterium]|nr:MAG: glycoside hydrolase [bacterium]
MPHYGFNFLWAFIWEDGRDLPPAEEKALDFLAKHGFDFVRVPTDYRYWTHGHDYLNPDERALAKIDGYIDSTRQRGLHASLNIHRAPGYCINSPEIELHNLWTDKVAEDAFVFNWENFARRYQGISSQFLSFDLLNEPPSEGQRGFTKDIHERIMRRTVAAIRAIDPNREIVLDGLGAGSYAMPELADLDVIQSGRGYQPMPVSHHDANWWSDYEGRPTPVYPGTEWNGIVWNRDTLREFYKPWRDLEAMGVKVHIGEMGCFNRTPNDVALRWLGDVFGLYKEFGWGYALWNFTGDFGIIDHGRPGAVYEELDGYRVDRDLLELMIANRI